MPNNLSFKKCFSPWSFLDIFEKGIEILDSVRIRLSNSQRIMIMRSHDSKGKCIIIPIQAIDLILISKILNGTPRSKPTLAISFLRLERMHTRLHSIIKKWVTFQHVHNIYFYSCLWWNIGDFEIKPLSVAFAVDIILQNQIVFIVAYSVHCEQISRFEIWAECKWLGK